MRARKDSLPRGVNFRARRPPGELIQIFVGEVSRRFPFPNQSLGYSCGTLSLRELLSPVRQFHRDENVRPWGPAGTRVGTAVQGTAWEEFAELLIRFVSLGHCRENLASQAANQSASHPGEWVSEQRTSVPADQDGGDRTTKKYYTGKKLMERKRPE